MAASARLILGCGYLGRRVGRAWLATGSRVYAATRSAARAADLAAEGFTPVVADVTRPETLKSLSDLPAIETVLYAVGFDRSAGLPIRAVYVDGLRHALAALPRACGQFVYISSTGVYGDAAGEWIDESSPCQPERENGRACLEAESLLAADANLAPRTTILRLAGIYGPGRVPNRAALVAGQSIVAPAEGYLNLIHVDDAVTVVLAAGSHPPRSDARMPRLYLVSDGHPSVRSDYYAELARLYGAPRPVLESPAPHDPAAQRASGSKRVANHRMLTELGETLRYPSYREGLAAIVAQHSAAASA